jgi:hypothetical protein
MAINELLKIVARPPTPVEAENGKTWTRVQKVIGTRLPRDFRDFGTHYGTGKLCGGYLGVLNPFSVHFVSSVTYLLQATRDNRATHDYPYQVFPDEPGLLPWGTDENGHTLHWLTEGAPDEWPVVVESHEGELERFNLSMTTFLAKAFTNVIRPKHIWGTPFSPEELTFTPIKPKAPQRRGGTP